MQVVYMYSHVRLNGTHVYSFNVKDLSGPCTL